MATFSASIETKATGPLKLEFTMSEERAQDIFAMLLGTSSPITVISEKPGGISTVEPRKLGQCLRDEITTIIGRIENRAIDWKKRKAALDAAALIVDVPEVTVVEPK